MNPESISRCLGIDVETTVILLETWINSADEDMAALRACGGRADVIIHHAHKIKGASAQLFLDEAAALAAALEAEAKAGNTGTLEVTLEKLSAIRMKVAEELSVAKAAGK